ncbi:MAG: hypothetical protein OEY18_07945, partial [Candidatus Aminicenantes bacterium]|nr:hypothetical protein [Candidatus Aminicenantes bacterium]
MKKSVICLFLVISVIALGTSCRGGKNQENNSVEKRSQAKEESSQEIQRPYGKQRGQQKRQAVWQGVGRRGLGRNPERAWSPGDVVELS